MLDIVLNMALIGDANNQVWVGFSGSFLQYMVISQELNTFLIRLIYA